MATEAFNIQKWINKPVAIIPLAGFRVLFACCLFISTLRFMFLGWIEDHYLEPLFHFHYYGFEWLPLAGKELMYAIHILLLISSLAVILGYRYRLFSLMQFLCFTYTELIDLTYYLNHYYYVSLVCLLLIFLPANGFFSLDVKWGRVKRVDLIPRWMLLPLMLMIGIVYSYAGIAKINYDWLIEALPLRIWLPASYDIPLLGHLFAWKYSPWVFSWFGMFYDCTIIWFLLYHRTRPWAYLSVIIFHGLTSVLFQIGVFPLVMVAGTLIFFSADWHLRWMKFIAGGLQKGEEQIHYSPLSRRIYLSGLSLFFLFQLLFPWRFLLYPGKLLWTEEGYRFSWRVMLMEKAGTAQFYIKDGENGREGFVENAKFLNSHQEKQMSFQQDMILQFAHFLQDYYKSQGMQDPIVRAEVYVTLNGRPSALFIDSSANLASLEDNWRPKSWVLPYPHIQ